jgi:hypothetical protein
MSMKAYSFPGSLFPSVLLLLSGFMTLGYSQSGDAFPLNSLNPEVVKAIEINGVSFRDLQQSEGDEGLVASLCACPYTVLKSEDPDLPWVAYTLFEGEQRLSLSFSSLDDGRLGITHLDLLGPEATVTLKGVTLSKGDSMAKLGSVKSHRQYNDGALHFALFPAGVPDTFFHIDFEPVSGKIEHIGYIAPF